MKVGWVAFKDRTSSKVGLGNKVKFWGHRWFEDMPFEGVFPKTLFYSLLKKCLGG